MKHAKKLAALLLLLALSLQLFACHSQPSETTPPTTTEPTESTTEPTTEAPPTAADIYEDAIAAMEAEEAGAYDFMISTIRYSGNAVIQDETNRTLRYSGLGTDSYTAVLDNKTSMADWEPMEYREVYNGGSMYWFIPNEKTEDGQEPVLFTCRMDAQAYQQRLLPLNLLDPSLYGSAVIETEGHLVFTEPTALETWLIPEDSEYVTLTDARGELQLDSQGKLKTMTYEVSYTQGFVEFEQKFTLTPAAAEAELNTTLPARETPIVLENMDLLNLMMFSNYAAYSMADCSAVCETTDLIVSEAGGAVLILNNEMQSCGSGAEYMAKVSNSGNISQGQQQGTYETEEIVRDGTDTYSVNGEVSEVLDEVDTEKFAEYILLETTFCLPHPSEIASAELSEVGGYWRIFYTGNDTYSRHLEDRATKSLFQDPDMLDDLAEAYETDLLECYLYINKDTLLPAALSISLESRHKVEGYYFALNVNTDQTFDYGDPGVYEEITEEMFSEEEPEEKATPVFYEVTSPEGQKMYLLGTIHIGDERTAYLPQEIYDAFDASDALAVEFDLLSFYDEVEADEEMQEAVAETYYYSDGTTAKQHLPEEQYEQLMDMARFCGMTLMAENMYPSIVSNQYTNRMLFGSNTLTSLQGVDYRFLTMAHEREMEVLEVESAELQMGMDGEYSDLLQKYLVIDAYETDRNSYVAHSIELYELWCSGDEAALMEYLRDDEIPEDATEEEIQANEEYNNHLLANRDAGMLEKAEEYLASGKTVFFAVGLAHLLGETGLVDALREAGYTVTLVEYAQ